MKRMRFVAAAAAAVMCMSSVSAYASDAGWESGVGTGRYILEDGSAAVGVLNVNGVAYRFDSSGICLGKYTGLTSKNGAVHYYIDGIMYKGGWLKLGGGTYYFDGNGTAYTGIVTIGGRQYNFGSDGRLTDSLSDAFSVTSDKQVIVKGGNEEITFTFTAKNISGTAYMGEICELQRYSDGKWYKVNPTDEYAVDDIAHMLGNVGEPYYYVESVRLSFTPEEYSDNLRAGKYRIAQTISTEFGQKRLYCEFMLINNAEISTERESYDIMSTEKIFITGYTAKADEYYAEAEELYVYNDDTEKWEKVEPKSSQHVFPAHISAVPGEKISSCLDLTRYSRTRLKSGKYRTFIGDNISCEFELTNPYDVYVNQSETKSKSKKQVLITFVNSSDSDITVKGYGELMRLSGGKWRSVTAKKELDTEVTIPAMYKWNKSMLLNTYYSASSLKSGSYCMKFPTSDGKYVYAYFELN